MSNTIGWERIYMTELHVLRNVGSCIAGPKWNDEWWDKFNCTNNSIYQPIPKKMDSRRWGTKAGRILNILT